jgi:hypothetical protein
VVLEEVEKTKNAESTENKEKCGRRRQKYIFFMYILHPA